MIIKRPMKGAQVKDFSKITFPKLASPKIDGFRCIVSDIARTSSLEPFPNVSLHNTFKGLLKKNQIVDGEIVVGKKHKSTSAKTSRGVTSRTGKPDFTLWVFDAPRKGVRFRDRLALARRIVKDLDHVRVRFLKHVWLEDMEQLQEYLDWALNKGFEGIVLRNPEGSYKEGKSTLREQGMLKIKPFVDFEARIIGYFEEEKNTNAAKKNAAGKSKRSSAKSGKRPKGTLGGFIGLADGVEVRVGGGFTAKQRQEFWQNREAMIGQIMTCKKQLVGEKDKPRHPVFKAIRHPIDMDTALD